MTSGMVDLTISPYPRPASEEFFCPTHLTCPGEAGGTRRNWEKLRARPVGFWVGKKYVSIYIYYIIYIIIYIYILYIYIILYIYYNIYIYDNI